MTDRLVTEIAIGKGRRYALTGPGGRHGYMMAGGDVDSIRPNGRVRIEINMREFGFQSVMDRLSVAGAGAGRRGPAGDK